MIIGRIKSSQFIVVLAAMLSSVSWVCAGDIVGTVAVPKSDHAVVYVEKVPGKFQAGHAVMDQKNKVFIPYLLPVVQGTTVEFHNSDNLQHNVFGVGAVEFNLGTYGQGATKGSKFDKPGEVDILCNVHPEMAAYILVLQNPYFTQPDGSGKFRIANVPPGEYVLKVWYEGKTRKQNVKVLEKGDVSAGF
jgi:plastocyanin